MSTPSAPWRKAATTNWGSRRPEHMILITLTVGE